MPPLNEPPDFTKTRQNLSSASQSWALFDLDSRRPSLDQTAATTKQNRESSLHARKTLAELTKNFKRSIKSAGSPTPESRDIVDKGRTAIKAYQEEIDQLTKRCKTSDGAFLGLYQNLFELPDPATVLPLALELLDRQQLEVENLTGQVERLAKEGGGEELETLRKEVAEYEEEFKTLKNQDITIRNLEAEIESLKEAKDLEKVDEEVDVLTSKERDELVKLRTEVAEYEVEFRGLKNQDITIRKLEAKIVDMEREQEETITKEIKKMQDELIETEGRRATDALEREAKMERQLQSVELQLRAERAGREATQAHLVEADEGAEMREAAWEAQRQILVDDAERSREMLQEVSRERDELRLKLGVMDVERKTPQELSIGSAPPSGMGVADMMAERRAYEAEVNELTVTASTLREELRVKDETMLEERQKLQSTIQSLEEKISSLQSQYSALQSQIASAPSQASIEKMERELRVLKRLEYNAELEDAPENPEMTDQDLETVLVSRLQKVESELLKEKREKTDISKDNLKLQKTISNLEQTQKESEKLIISLERDLQKAIAVNPQANTTTTATSPSLPPPNSDPNTLQTIMDPNAPPLPNTPATPPLKNKKKSDDKNTDSVATIIMAQRDRLRARLDTVEAERDSFKKELQMQVKLSESLKTDNTKLYEKVRYLQNFQNKHRPPSSRDRDLDLEALEERYEASVDPFRQFSKAERQRKLKDMSPMERIVFVTAKFVLGSKQMRTGLFIYVMSMHFLVFVTTYHWSHESGCMDLEKHDSLAHMHGGLPIDESAVAAATAAVVAGH